MELHQLRYFLSVAETGGFSRAAAKCGVAQPSLSQQIRKLEDELGVPLFDRLPRGAVLTEAGIRFREHAERILASINDARRQVGDLRGQVSGRLAVGAIPTIAPYLLPKALRRLLKRHPQVEVRIEENFTEVLVEQLVTGRVELAVMALPVEHDGLHAEPLLEEPLLAAMPADHALAKKKKVTWGDLNQERLILLHEMHCLGRQMGALCRRLRSEPDLSFLGSQLSTMQQMVALGMGLSLIPEMAASADSGSSRVYRPFSQDPPMRTVAVFWHLHRYRTNAARAMVEALRAVATPRKGS